MSFPIIQIKLVEHKKEAVIATIPIGETVLI